MKLLVAIILMMIATNAYALNLGVFYDIKHGREPALMMTQELPTRKTNRSWWVSGGVSKTQKMVSGGHFWRVGKTKVGFGVGVLSDPGEVVGTPINFEIRVKHPINKRVDFSYIHFSNGRSLGIGNQDKTNRGYNFVGFEFKL